MSSSLTWRTAIYIFLWCCIQSCECEDNFEYEAQRILTSKPAPVWNHMVPTPFFACCCPWLTEVIILKIENLPCVLFTTDVLPNLTSGKPLKYLLSVPCLPPFLALTLFPFCLTSAKDCLDHLLPSFGNILIPSISTSCFFSSTTSTFPLFQPASYFLFLNVLAVDKGEPRLKYICVHWIYCPVLCHLLF